MNASSQTPHSALPPELAPVRQPLPVEWPPAAEAPALEAAAPTAEPTAVTPLHAAAALLDAELVRLADTGDEVTGEGLAAVEETAGILFDPQRAEEIAAAARAQVRDEYAADIVERGNQLALLSDQNRALRMAAENRKKSLDAVLHLVEGRPGTDLLTVDEVLAAAGGAQRSDAPLALSWNPERGVELPSDGGLAGRAIVPCTTARGGSAALVLEGEQRQALASLLDLQVRDINAPCATPGCGEAADAELSDLFGWSRLEIASLNHGPRWYCSDMCVMDALARAGHELAAADRQAEQGGDL